MKEYDFPVIIPQVLEKIKSGYSARRACESCDISYHTFKRYCIANKINFPRIKNPNSWWRKTRTTIS